MITKPTKYTEAFVKEELKDMLYEIRNDKDIIFIGQLFENRDYSRQRFSEWLDKFAENEEISDTIKKIESMLESRAVVGGMQGKLNPTMTIFHLKNNHDWKDKKEYEGDLNIKGSLVEFIEKEQK